LNKSPGTDCLVEKNTFFDWFTTYRTLVHSVSTHLASAMSTQKNHILKTIHANRTTRLQQNHSQIFGKRTKHHSILQSIPIYMRTQQHHNALGIIWLISNLSQLNSSPNLLYLLVNLRLDSTYKTRVN